MTESNIFFLDSGPEPSAQITQLYHHLELFSDGEPLRNTLFVLGRQTGGATGGTPSDRLLLIDPPANVLQRFRLEGEAAALFTGEPEETGLPIFQTQAGGVAHIRIGEHFLDIYSQAGNNIVHFSALGILCSGGYGSDTMVPRIADGSDGSVELETLRLLASLLKRRHFQLFIPRLGSLGDDTVEVMNWLAADVAYLNALRRLAVDRVKRGNAIETEFSLPTTRSSATCQAIHDANVETVMNAIRGGADPQVRLP